MQLAFLGPVSPHRGGIAQHSSNLIEALVALGHSVDVVTWRRQYPGIVYRGYRPTESELDRANAVALIDWNSPRSWRIAARRLAAREPRALIVPWVTPLQAPVYRYFGSRLDCQLAVLLHNTEMHEGPRFGRGLLRQALARASVVLTHSHYNLAQLGDLPGGIEVKVVPHPPNLSLHASPIPAGPPYTLLFLGFVRPYKGVMDLIEATKLLLVEGFDVRTVIAGEFWDPVDKYHDRIQALELHDRVEIHDGFVEQAFMQALLESAHIVVLPYRSATQSGVAPLAFAAGRSVVATAVGGLPEQVEAGVAGELALPNNPKSLAQAIKRALGRLDALSEGARGASSTWKEVATALLASISRK